MEHFSWYNLVPGFEKLNEALRQAGFLGKEENAQHVISGLLVLLFVTILGFVVSRRYRDPEKNVVPARGIGLVGILEITVEMLSGLVESVIGHGATKHVWLLVGTFLFILFSNLLGCIPGFPPPTSTVTTNVCMALTVFLYYNYVGVRVHGPGYIKQFLGPVWWLAFLMFPIEVVGHLVRPVSLSLRLAGNITGDHMVLGIFASKFWWIGAPLIFIGMGVFVAVLQAFVFTLLSTIYVSMASSHDH